MAVVVIIGAIAVFLAGFGVGIVLATAVVKRRRYRHGPHREAPARPSRRALRVRHSDLNARMSHPNGGLSQ
jgi:hypothetical protein